MEASPKYKVYQLDASDTPVLPIYQYICEECGNDQEYNGGRSKKPCIECKGIMRKLPTGEFEPGTPARGVILNYMYVKRNGQKKYKVNFPAFGIKEGRDGLTESEMKLVQAA